jgi:Patatin-like phospholipase
LIPLIQLARQASIFVALASAQLLTACSSIPHPRDSFTASEQSVAKIPGIPGARFWLDGSSGELQDFMKNSAISQAGSFDILAMSGGAFDGAYGAGVINGWTAAGTRPQFTVVTGVSAGALIATLAFLGPDRDREIAEAFTERAAQLLGDLDGALAFLQSPDMRRSALVDLVDKFADAKFLEAVAAEHAKGRGLLIVTTNLDAHRGVVWDMGAIAASGQPNARELFRDVLVASASIPGVFAPTFIEAEANGRRFKEMHVDGGTTTEVFILPDAVFAAGTGLAKQKSTLNRIWVVINNHVTPKFEVVEAGLLPAISHSFSTLIKSNSKQTLFAASKFVGRDRFNLTYIDDSFDQQLEAKYGTSVKPGFNSPYMTALHRYGYEKARSGNLWTHEVPLPGGTRGRTASPVTVRQ